MERPGYPRGKKVLRSLRSPTCTRDSSQCKMPPLKTCFLFNLRRFLTASTGLAAFAFRGNLRAQLEK